MEIKVASVSEIVYSIKKSLEQEFREITVMGEISNLSYSSAGHYYFTLSDENAALSCALFKMDAFKNPVIRKLKDGDKVMLRGPISVYAKRGTFQVICKRITPYGKGDLKAQYEFLKEKLRSEGIFDEEYKLEVPEFPRRIAVLTAKRGAALQDFLNILKRRSIWLDVLICPVTVQGDDCAPSVIKALEKVQKLDDIDVIVITRGGGSMEDLWGFNDERLVRKVFACKIPVISAIGHQVDYTLLDYVSDLRCETPSAAAEVLSQTQTGLKERLRGNGNHLKSLFVSFKMSLQERLDRVNPMQFLHQLHQLLGKHRLSLKELDFFSKEDGLDIRGHQTYIDELASRLERKVHLDTEQLENKLNLFSKVLNSLNPHNVLGRGYTYLSLESGKVLSTSKEFDSIVPEQVIDVHFSDGKRQVKKVE